MTMGEQEQVAFPNLRQGRASSGSSLLVTANAAVCSQPQGHQQQWLFSLVTRQVLPIPFWGQGKGYCSPGAEFACPPLAPGKCGLMVRVSPTAPGPLVGWR